MRTRTSHRIAQHIAGSGVVLAILGGLVGGLLVGVGALVGAAVALSNWLVMIWVVRRALRAGHAQRVGLMLLLALKMGALMVLCWALLARFGVHPVGFAVGLSALVIGSVLGAMGSDAGDDMRGTLEEEG